MQQQAGLLIVNAKVITLDPAAPFAEAVAIEGGKISAAGTEGDFEATVKQKPVQIIDAEGGTVMPGFSENHMHLFEGTAELDHLQLSGISGIDALAAALKSYAASRRGQPVLFAQGADYAILGEGRSLDRNALDAVLADQAVLVMAQDHHTAWANTLALQSGGILHGASLSPGNTVVMGEDGLGTSELREMEAFRPIQAAGGFDRYRLGLSTGGEPEPFPDEATFRLDMEVMRRGLAHCGRHGITSVHNMDGNLYQLQLLEAIEREDGFLPCRVKIPFHFKNHMRLEMLDKAVDMSRRYNSDFLSSGLVKVTVTDYDSNDTALAKIRQGGHGFDMVVPSKNVENAKLFQNFVMDPENAAGLSAFARYGNGISGSDAFMPTDMKGAPELTVPEGIKVSYSRPCAPEVQDIYTKIWTEAQK